MTVRVARRVVGAILAEAAASPDREVCGLLFGSVDRVAAALPCANVAARPETAFEIDPAALIAAYRRERGGGTRIVGCYHSHPGGIAAPSPRDADAADANDWLWLIAGGGAVQIFRAATDGAIHGRFDRIDWSLDE